MIELSYPVNALVSYHYFSKRNIKDYADGGLRLIGDSGAFSAANLGTPVDIDEFGEWASRWRDSLAWVASLDVIGDAAASWKNYRHLRQRHDLDVVPTIHYGSDPALLDGYAADGVDMVGLGGMVGRKNQPKHLLRWCLSVFRYARDKHPKMRFHGWGVTHSLLLESLPWYSVDSSGFGRAYRFGHASIYNPDTNTTQPFAVDGRDAYRLATTLRKHYGALPQDVAVSTPGTRAAHIRLAARSYQLLEARLRTKFRVSAPTYGQNFAVADFCVFNVMGTDHATPRALVGPNVHAVDAVRKHLLHLRDPAQCLDS